MRLSEKLGVPQKRWMFFFVSGKIIQSSKWMITSYRGYPHDYGNLHINRITLLRRLTRITKWDDPPSRVIHLSSPPKASPPSSSSFIQRHLLLRRWPRPAEWRGRRWRAPAARRWPRPPRCQPSERAGESDRNAMWIWLVFHRDSWFSYCLEKSTYDVNDCSWLLMIVNDCEWLWMIVNDC